MSYGWNGWPEAKARSKETGMCGRCEKRPASGGTHFCVECRNRASERSRAIRARHKANGECVQCGRRAEKGKTLCFRCGAKDQRRAKARKEKRIAQGLCGTCGKAPLVEGKRSCQACLDKNRAKLRARWGDPAESVAKGVCHTCGEGKPAKGRKSCEWCLAAAKAHAKRSYRDRIAAGKCGRCGGERDTEYNTCSACLARRRAARGQAK